MTSHQVHGRTEAVPIEPEGDELADIPPHFVDKVLESLRYAGVKLPPEARRFVQGEARLESEVVAGLGVLGSNQPSQGSSFVSSAEAEHGVGAEPGLGSMGVSQSSQGGSGVSGSLGGLRGLGVLVWC